MNSSISSNPLNLIVHFRLDYTVHCAETVVIRKRGTGEGACRVLCTWQLLALAVKKPWLASGWPILVLAG